MIESDSDAESFGLNFLIRKAGTQEKISLREALWSAAVFHRFSQRTPVLIALNKINVFAHRPIHVLKSLYAASQLQIRST